MLDPILDRDQVVQNYISALVKLGAGDSAEKTRLLDEMSNKLVDDEFTYAVREAGILIRANTTAVEAPSLEELFLRATTLDEKRALMEQLAALPDAERIKFLEKMKANQSPAEKLLAEIVVEGLPFNAYLLKLDSAKQLSAAERAKFDQLLDDYLSKNINSPANTIGAISKSREATSVADILKAASDLFHSELSLNHPAVIYVGDFTKKMNDLRIDPKILTELQNMIKNNFHDQSIHEKFKKCAEQVSKTFAEVKTELEFELKKPDGLDLNTMIFNCYSYLVIIDMLEATGLNKFSSTPAQRVAFHSFFEVMEGKVLN